ncbi:hypothetical protein [Sphingomonas flavalba]|uniref:hypothetical protein n=1 Tax=Sphingomonas flavalba TaxID=2559804 RepID=UPI001EF0FAE2|nr:hypothetical protein [Sphingomonas flavalba]
MTRLALPLLLLPVLALSGAGEPTGAQRQLAKDIAGRTAGKPAHCVPTSNGSEALRIIDERTLAYRDGRTLWVSRLDAPCPGLAPARTLVTETFGGQYCRGDRFYTLQPGSTMPGSFCLLGDFTPYRQPR